MGDGQQHSEADDDRPEAIIKAWLKLTRNDEGHLKVGDYMAALVPFLDVHSVSPSSTQPSVTFSYTVQPDHCNRLQSLHGGAAATLFDFCTTLAIALLSRPGFWQLLGVSRSLSVTYLQPARCGEQVFIQCQVLQIGKRFACLRGIMKRKSDGQLLCTCEHEKVNVDPSPGL